MTTLADWRSAANMNKWTFFTLSFLLLEASQRVHSDEDLGRGLGEKYEWHTLDKGLKLSQETGKPLMLIIHKSWCGACKAFKPKFAASSDILKLSEKFVMVNTLDNEEPQEAKYSPDGGYIPRILFLDSDGEVHTEIYNENGNPKYKYFYFDDKTVLESMKTAVNTLYSEGRGDEL